MMDLQATDEVNIATNICKPQSQTVAAAVNNNEDNVDRQSTVNNIVNDNKKSGADEKKKDANEGKQEPDRGLSLPLNEEVKFVNQSRNGEPSKQVFKVIILGDSGVGKTCLTYRLCMGKFLYKSHATVGVDFREKIIQVGLQVVKLQIWDTAGQERFRRSMVPHYYRNIHGVVYTYDINNYRSFDNLPHWISECEQYIPAGRMVAKVLVGNKCDAALTTETVPTNIAQRFAESHGMSLFETSAKDDMKKDHVESIFVSLIYDLVSARRNGFMTPPEDRRQQLIELKPLVAEYPASAQCSC